MPRTVHLALQDANRNWFSGRQVEECLVTVDRGRQPLLEVAHVTCDLAGLYLTSGKQGQDDNAIYGLKNYIIYLICPILIHGLTKVDINPYCLWAGAIIRTPIDLVHV